MAKKNKSKTEAYCDFLLNDFIEHNENYEKKNIADETKRYCIINGINRNVARHIPSGFDGLKPVARRTLLVLSEDSSRQFQKVSAVSGAVMGKYHPHGDTAIEEVIGKMGQWWTNNVLYIDPDGNFGNLQGDEPAAGRYIKCRLSKFAHKCFFEDYKYASLDMRPTYTGKGKEPEYLPVKYPIAIINPQFSSIGYGTSANIAPYNFTEVMEATIKLLKDPDAKITLIPDFPNGCEVVADKFLDEVNTHHGRGKVTVRAEISIDHDKNVINILSLPLKMGTKKVISNISKLIVEKKLDGISDIKDNTSARGGYWIKIILNKDTNPDKMVETLMKKDVGLQKTFGVQIKFIEDYKENDYSPKEYLLNWIDFRREIVQSMHNKKYVQLKQEEHMNDIKIFVFSKDNISRTLSIIRKTRTKDESVEKMMEAYKGINMTSLQAKTICNMRVHEFNKESYEGFLKRRDELKEEIKHSEDIISNPALIDEIILKELEEGIKLFGTPRRSKIIYAKDKAKKVSDKIVTVAISKDGFVKKIDSSKYSTIGALGMTSSREVIIIKIENNKNLLVFDSNGKVSKVPVAGIPEMTPDENGLIAERYFKVTGRIVSVMEEEEKSDILNDLSIIFVTKKGYTKRTPFKEFLTMRDLKVAINIEPDDELVATALYLKKTSRPDDIIIYTSKGNGIRLSMEDIQKSASATKGKIVLKMSEDEVVEGIDRVKASKKLLFYVTSAGRVKVTEAKYFPTMDKKDAAVSLLSLSTNEKLVSVTSVNKTDRVMVFRKIGEPVELSISDITPSMRVAKAEKMIKVPKGDIVVSVRVLSQN